MRSAEKVGKIVSIVGIVNNSVDAYTSSSAFVTSIPRSTDT